MDQIKLKAFTDDKLNVTKIVISVFDKVENIVGKGEIVQAISPFPTMFSKDLFPRPVKRCHCVGQMIEYVSERIENIVGKEENAGYPAFSPFSTMFSKDLFFPGWLTHYQMTKF